MSAISQKGGYIDAREFYDYLLNLVRIRFSPKVSKDLDEENFELALSRKMTYDQFSAKVGEHLKVDPTHIRFSTVNATTGKVKAVVKRNPNQSLYQITSPQFSSYGSSNQRSDALYYEVMEISLSELETKKLVKVTWVSEGLTKEVVFLKVYLWAWRLIEKQETFDVLIAKNGVVGDILPQLQKKAKLDEETIQNTRMYVAHGCKIYKEIMDDYAVASIQDSWTLFAERIPDEERNSGEDDKAIYAFHFDKEPSRPHSVPFKFIVKPVSSVYQSTDSR